MPKSFNLSKVLSRLPIRGAVLNTTGAPAHKYEGNVPLLGPDNKLDPSVIGAGTVNLGDVDGEDISFAVPPEKDTGVTNVRDAINNITKDTGGLAAMRSKNLTDLANPATAFNAIKGGAGLVSGGAATGGVIAVASQTEVTAGTDTATEASISSVRLAVSPSTAKNTYLSKLVGGNQTINSTLTLGGPPTTDPMATTKVYVDTLVNASNLVSTGNTIFVDSINGNDTTGLRGAANKPVRTLTRAKTLANAGDVIIVGPGTYNENDLSKNGVSWYFRLGAKVVYTSDGDSSVAVFNVASNEACYIGGYGEFWHTHSSASTRFVFYVRTGGQLVMEGNWVQSTLSAIYVDAGSTGYATFNIRDSLRSDNAGAGTGSCAAKLVTGVCHLYVGREIYSNGSQNQTGLEFGTGSSIYSTGYQVVKCPRILGKWNAIHFNGTTRAIVYTDTCSATDGPAVKCDGGSQNILYASADLRTTSASDPAITMNKGQLTLVDSVVYAVNGQPGILLNGTPGDPQAPYLILNNTQIWCQGLTVNAVLASQIASYTMRIIGMCQSDVNAPSSVLRSGAGVWDNINIPVVVAPPTVVQDFKITTSGLVATVGAGSLVFEDGTTVAIGAQTVYLTPSSTNYIVIRLDSAYTAHSYYRYFDTASVHVATVVTNSTTATTVTQRATFPVPKSATAGFNGRLRNNLPCRVLLIGDSLTYGAGGGPYFFDLVFNSANAASGYNLPNIGQVTLSRRAAPGGTAIFGTLMTADIFQPAPSASNWFTNDHLNYCQAILPGVNAELTTPISRIGPNPYVSTLPDLVIINLGTNSTTTAIELLEQQLRFWNDKGVACVISTGIQRYDGPTSTTPIDPRIKLVAEETGASFWDLDAAYAEARNVYTNFGGTNPTHTDNVHFSTYGQTVAAASLKTVLCPSSYQGTLLRTHWTKRAYASTNTSSAHAHVALNFPFSVGTSQIATGWNTDNLQVMFGGTATGSSVTSVPTGAYVMAGFPLVSGGVWGIFENQSADNFSWTITHQGSTTIASGSVTGASIPMQIIQLASFSTISAFSSTNSINGFTLTKGLTVPLSFRFNVTSGTAKLVGFLFETPLIEEIPLDSISTYGDWIDETCDFATGSRVVTGNTIGDRAIIRAANCDGISVCVRIGNAAGTISASIDGISGMAASDLYTASAAGTALLSYLTFVPGVWPTYAADTSAVSRLSNNRRLHQLRLSYDALNGSAVATTAASGRLTIARAFALKF